MHGLQEIQAPPILQLLQMRPWLDLSSFENSAFLNFSVLAIIAGDYQKPSILDCLLDWRGGLKQL